MGTIADSDTLDSLIERLRSLTPDTEHHWGTMTAAEMICHLGDTNEAVLGTRVPESRRKAESRARNRPFFKWLALRSPLRWPHGFQTGPGSDPKREGTKPESFSEERERVISTLRSLAVAADGDVSCPHPVWGAMSLDDWHAWAYKHHDHHLRQFGL